MPLVLATALTMKITKFGLNSSASFATIVSPLQGRW